MIKKTITYIFTLVIILILYEIIFSFLKTGHDVSYTISKDNKLYSINEIYTKKGKDNYYLITVSDENNTYLFSVNNKFNKQKNIVKDIEYYEISNDLSCMILDLVNKDNTIPICTKNNVLYTYHALKDKYDLSSLEGKIKKYESNNNSVYDEDNNKCSVNYGFIDANEYISIYNLKDVYFYHNNVQERLNFSNYDNYKNEYGYLVGNRYVIPRIISNPEFYNYIVYNVETKKSDSIDLDEHPISKDSYINGVYENCLYVVDRSNKKQYRLDPVELTALEVGNTEMDGYAYINGKLERKSIYQLIEKDIIFTESGGNYEGIDYDSIYVQSNYAYYLKNGTFYKVYEKNLNLPVYLFDAKNPTHVKFRNDNIYFIDDNKLYKYNEYGLNVLVTKDEFRFHEDDIYDIYLS